MSFILGSLSRKNLIGVHPDLVKVAEGAITVTPVDFRVQEGLRTLARQKVLFAAGASTTLDSQHLVQRDGFGHAVDLVPYLDFDGDGDSELRWDWPLGYKIAEAMQKSALGCGVKIRWGGCWDQELTTLGDPEMATLAYVQRRHNLARRAFLDAPHFELWRKG